MDPDSRDDDRIDALRDRIADLEAKIPDGPSRRQVLAGGGLLAAGGLLGGGASQQVSAQSAAGQIGTSSEPVDVEAASVNAGSVNADSTVINNELGLPVVSDPTTAPTGGGRMVYADGTTKPFDPGIWVEDDSTGYNHVASFMANDKNMAGTVPLNSSLVAVNNGGTGTVIDPPTNALLDEYDITLKTGTDTDSIASFTQQQSTSSVEAGKMSFNMRIETLSGVDGLRVSFGDQGGDAYGFEYTSSTGEIRAAYWNNSSKTVASSGFAPTAAQNYSVQIYFRREQELWVGKEDTPMDEWTTINLPSGIFPSRAVAARIQTTDASDKQLHLSSPSFVATSG